MNDNQLFTLARSVILAGLAARGMNGWSVARKFQPRHTGAKSTPTVYVFKIADKLHGSPARKYAYNAAGQVISGETTQQYETTFQASALVEETTDPDALTPSDVCNVVAAILQSDVALDTLRAAGVGIFRVGAVVNPYNVNDRDEYQAGPSFDFTLTYRRTDSANVPAAVSVEAFINRV